MVLLSNEGILKISFDPIEYEYSPRIYPFKNSDIYSVHITDCIKLTNGDDVKDVYEITLDVKDINYDFEPGDTIGVLPHNNEDEINDILKLLNCDSYDRKCYFYVENEKKKRYFAHLNKSTIKEVFIENLDVRTPAKKCFLKALSNYCSDNDKKLLESLSHPKSNNYFEFINENSTLLSLLNKIPSCNPPIDLIIENLPPLQPRPYSIASSPLIKNKINLIFSIIKNINLNGVCTSYLKKLALTKGEIQFYYRKSTFKIINSPPIIMIAPGTGIAPFLSFLHTISNNSNQNNYDNTLFFGCRYESRDFLHQNDLKKYLDEGILTQLKVAFSRESKEKVYVTDLMKNASDLIFKKFYIEDGTIYVCGDAKNLFREVKKILLEILIENGIDGDEILKKKISNGKYVEDKWI